MRDGEIKRGEGMWFGDCVYHLKWGWTPHSINKFSDNGVYFSTFHLIIVFPIYRVNIKK